ncbi:hypothetical protein HF1_13710 [Mycoplasma haemofelis str. Langford 1]|uniref:Uncharacterized protein n=1 Tax=Mycoplasma haemofelis (strain Langford 1) TaxID=941640 RepID=E8ZJQ8_MYCHL|nr:hypothetical protein [Mycoplasma haemofelis]CBY93379.1 hypothetical protein HF1_13710 [Mycoplasma haemofelis str. Langford 1]
MDIKFLSIPVALTGGAGGSYLGYRYLHQETPKESIKSKLGNLLLEFGDNFSGKWQDRATLVSSKNDLPESLSKLKTSGSNISSEAIKGWCKEHIEKEFTSETDALFVGIRNYCTFNNKDKLTGKAISETLDNSNLKSNGQWSKANGKLKQVDDNQLSPKMKEIKDKIKDTASPKDDKALKNWCETTYTEYFKDLNDQNFKDAESYCTEVTQSVAGAVSP